MAIKREIKVGIFVIIGLIVAGALIFLIGDERRLFDRHYDLQTSFTDVAGLKAGAPVRMGGIDVGSVKTVSFAEDPNDHTLHVTFSVIAAAHDRIHDDSLVSVANKGLLGDKMLEVSQGSEGRPVIPDGGNIKGLPPDDFQKYLAKADAILDQAKKVMANLEEVTDIGADAKVQADIKGTLASLHALVGDAASHDGFVHRLLTDKAMADHLDDVFIEGSHAGKSLDRVASEIRVLLRQAKEGPGIAHTLLYSKDGDKLVESLARTTDELAKAMEAVRTGKGAAHELVYGESGSEVTQNLAAMSQDLRGIVADIKAGKGTIGALIADPSVYEDVKTILGNLDRNEVLRALVRYTIKQDEEPPSPATAPMPATSSAPKP